MGTATISAQPGITASPSTSGPGTRRENFLGTVLEMILFFFDNEWKPGDHDGNLGPVGNNNNNNTTTTTIPPFPRHIGAIDFPGFLATLEAAYPSLNSRVLYRAPRAAAVAVHWFSQQAVPAPVVLLLMLCGLALLNPAGARRYLAFARRVVVFAWLLAYGGPQIIADLFFTNRIVQDPFPLWLVRFWRGFTTGLTRSLYGGVYGRRPVEPPSPPPTPPIPFAPVVPNFDDGIGDVDTESDSDDDSGFSFLIDRILRRTDRQERRDYDQNVARAVGRAMEYNVFRRQHEERAANRERRRWEQDREDEDARREIAEMERTGRVPVAVRAEVGYWWPWTRIALVVLALVGAGFGILYYCETLDAREDCNWIANTLCGGPGGVGHFEPLGYEEDEAFRQASFAGLGPVKYRFLSDGSKVRIDEFVAR